MSTPKLYSSFIPNGSSEPHLHTPRHQGLALGDPELSLSQVGWSASTPSGCRLSSGRIFWVVF